ncbi:MAG TPA: PPC domain-containing protein [Verrucomicrobiae bacterium]
MKTISLVIPLCLSIAIPLSAGTLGVDALSGTVGYGGGVTEGYEFQVTNSDGIVVDGLGFWDAQSDGFVLGQTFPVGLWEAGTGTLLCSTVITSSSTLTSSAHSGGDWRINGVTPIHLPPGLYRMGGLLPDVGANPTIFSDATVQLASGINLLRYLRHIDGTTLVMPDIPPPYPEATYVSATFTFTPGPMVTNAATFFYFTCSPTAWVGGGQTLTLTNNFSATRYGNLLSFSTSGYELEIIGAGSSLPTVGFYPGASRYPFSGSGVGMAFTSPGRGDNTLSGWFNVLQADYQTNGQVAAFAVDFVQYDETIVTRWNRGSIRFNSIIPVPGSPPPMRLSKLARTNGVVQFTLTGPQDTTCVIQTSSNLVTWVPLLTNTISPVGLLNISDSNTVAPGCGFYRAVSASGGTTNSSNDQFANRFTIPSTGGTVTGSNATATKESGEPNHGNAPGGKSVWWTWTAPAGGLVTISLDGSSFDTTLGVYQGTGVTSLTSVAQDDEGGAGSCSRVVFTATTGATYQIAVDGYSGASGNITLRLKQGLLNDAFADRLQLLGSVDYVIGSNVGATWESNEPYHWDSTGIHSVWWKWQAPASGIVTISTAGSNFDTIMAAYTGSSVTTLSLVANNDDYGAATTSQITFFATAGTVYQIAVDGYDVASGNIRLTLQQ